jgi:hypothetical protein
VRRFILPADWRGWPLVALALVLLNASVTFANVWPTAKIRWQNAVSIELAICVVMLACLPRRVAGVVRRGLPLFWLLLVLGHYLDVTAPGLYGRDFNLYWDSAHLGNVVAMIIEATSAWIVALVIGVAIVGCACAYALSAVAFGFVADALARRGTRVVLVTTAVALIVVFVFQRVTDRNSQHVVFAPAVIPEYAHQIRSVISMLGPQAVAPDLASSPAALTSTPDGLNGADVYLVFVESYGAITFDRADFSSALAPIREAFSAAVRDTGRHVVSAYVESPTFGGSSWLAHLSLMSGIDVRDPYSYQTLMTQPRETLSTTFGRAGYRRVALMPGMRQAWPEGAFYRYDAIYGRADLAYSGPRFGWWSIPDQFSLAKLDALEGPPASRPPLFVVFPTSTTHAPFGPVAPYQPNWALVLTPDAYDPGEVARILARPPDLTNLSADYAHAMSYEFTTFAGYLRQRGRDALVMILIGDHQPPAAVSGSNAPWTVPVHVVAGDRDLLGRLEAFGFRPGLTPLRPSLGGMHELVTPLLSAFVKRGE